VNDLKAKPLANVNAQLGSANLSGNSLGAAEVNSLVRAAEAPLLCRIIRPIFAT